MCNETKCSHSNHIVSFWQCTCLLNSPQLDGLLLRKRTESVILIGMWWKTTDTSMRMRCDMSIKFIKSKVNQFNRSDFKSEWFFRFCIEIHLLKLQQYISSIDIMILLVQFASNSMRFVSLSAWHNHKANLHFKIGKIGDWKLKFEKNHFLFNWKKNQYIKHLFFIAQCNFDLK